MAEPRKHGSTLTDCSNSSRTSTWTTSFPGIAYGAFPQVVATGGDAELLFKGDELVNNIVPDLALLGIAETVRVAVSVTAGDDENDPNSQINP